MKSAFVLGLALAANAQVDNELATSLPYNPSGADLVKNAGWGRHLPIPNRPTYSRFPTPTYSKYDEVADDELVSLSGADLVKYAKQSQQTTYRPVAHVVRDDEAEDELMVYYTKDSNGVKHYVGGSNTYPATRRDDEADDELVSLSGADLVKYAKQSQQTTYRPVAHVVRDDEADDELVSLPYNPSGADLVKYAKQSQQTTYRPVAHVVRDDRHVNLPYNPSGADLVKYAKQSQQTPYRPVAHVVRDDEADDELMVFYTKDSNGVKHYVGTSSTYPATRRDDEADDELAYLGHLIKESQSEKVEKKPEIRKNFRHAQKN